MTYEPGLGGEAIELCTAESYLGFQGGIDGHKFDYSFLAHDIDTPLLKPKEFAVPYTGTFEGLDRLLRATEADVVSKSAGTLVYGEWRKACYITGAAHKKSGNGRKSSTLNVSAVDGAWWRKVVVEFKPGSGTAGSGGLGYPHGYPHGYSRSTGGGSVETGSLVPCRPWLVFYGPVTDPYVIVGDNRYQVSGTLASGARVEVDGKAKTVRKIAQDGTVTNLFANALRGSGEGGGQYIFQPIAPGVQNVTWDDSFGVDIGWYEEVGEPPWSRS